jgi:hypothetical protein
VLTALPPAAGAGVLLGTLGAGASLVLVPRGDADAIAATERVTATAGCSVAGLTTVG